MTTMHPMARLAAPLSKFAPRVDAQWQCCTFARQGARICGSVFMGGRHLAGHDDLGLGDEMA